MTHTPELEAVARAICKANIGDECDWDIYQIDAQAALDALRPYREAEIKAAVEAEREACAADLECAAALAGQGPFETQEIPIRIDCLRAAAIIIRNREPGA